MTLKFLYILPATKTFAGIERVVDDICSELAVRYGDELEVDVMFTSLYKDAVIQQRYNRIDAPISGRWDLLRKIRRVVSQKRYDLVIVPQVEPTVLTWLAALGTGNRLVVYLHGNHKYEMRHTKAKIMFFLMKHLVLGRLAGVFGVSPTQLQSFHAMFPSDKPHRWVPNPVRSFAVAPEAPLARTGVTFVKVGRFAYQKGHDILLRAFARLRTARPEARLVLVGHGPDEAAVRRLIGELGLDDVVSIAHLPADPAPALRNADVYVSASRWEGWWLSICEALRFGLPVVASNCEFGPSDILTDARLGRLVPPLDEAALAEAMQYYCDNLDAERQHAAFRRDYIEKFNVENVVPMHAEALRDLAARR